MSYLLSYFGLSFLANPELTSPAKPSRPARAYVHVLSEDIIAPLSEKVRSTSFHDAKNTSNDPVLLGPPSVEFAPYARVPGNRSRKDGRQGTIDQDPDFVAFLESLTNPIVKPAPAEGETEKTEDEEVTTTPLVQYIKDKKANKAKEATSGKSSKRGKEKEAKAEKAESKKLLKRPDRDLATDSTPASPEKRLQSSTAKVEKATKEAVKAANKQAAVVKSKQQTPKETTQPSNTPTATSERRRERGDVSAAAKILQRDLGLAPSGGRRRGKAATATTESDRPKSEVAASETTPATPTVPTGPKGSPANTKASVKDNRSKSATTKVTATNATTVTPPESNTTSSTTEGTATPSGSASRVPKAAKQQKPKPPSVSPTATQAFLKHANPSQGVTEELLETAFGVFGKVTKVEIDKKKGFGYVDFADPDGLQKAITASPVPVAQSQVVVLERKNPPTQAKAAKTTEPTSQTSPAATQQSAGTQKRSRGPRTRGGRGNKKAAAGAGGDGGKPETADAIVTETQS